MVRPLALALVALAVLAAPAAAAGPTLTPAERAAITAVLDRYVPAAVERRDLRLAYELSGPQVRGGMTLREWLGGGIPVYAFPAAGRHFGGWVLTWVDGDDVGLNLLVQPRRGADIGPIAFNVQMTRRGGRWLVNAFLPQATFSRPGHGAKVFSERDLLPSGLGAATASGRLSPVWFAVPASIVLALVLALLGYLLHVRRRDRRAYAEYLESLR